MNGLHSLYVKKKFQNFKAEILNYKLIMAKQYYNEILPKIQAYAQTKAAKSMIYHDVDISIYPVKLNAVISKERLIAIVLYTDFTHLSSDFTSTFRKNDPFEPKAAIKKRHRNYWWWARLLKETVRCYGYTKMGILDEEFNYKYENRYTAFQHLNQLIGPFYCGMSRMMHLPQFNIHLLSPTSTSVHIEVAMKFSGEHGVIIEMNNDKVGSNLRGLDVSWISNFKEEDER